MGIWEDVSSSMIRRVRYGEGILEIQFTNGSIYAYDEVPEDEYQNLVNAGSAGQYFIENIKGNYSDRRVG